MPLQGNDLDLGASVAGKTITLRHALRLHHLAIVGLTGTGKSRYIEHLIRSDIRAWSRTRCGLLLIDPHGEVFDGIMAWVAATKRYHLPIIPIDFRRQDQIVGYNVLRTRSTEPMVFIDAFVKTMAFVFGAAGTDETPLFERWATNTLYKLYHEGKTLSEAAELFAPGGIALTDSLRDPMIRRDWQWAKRNPKDFETATSSSINRFRRFLLNPTLRAVFGNRSASLDFSKALEEGQIVLVSLARKSGTISRENADLFATLLLSDLWTSAEERGKGENVKAFYVYLDEFQRFMTPTMAESLAEARGFGLGLTTANQFPRQVLNSGPFGQRIFDEVMENTRSKVVFKLRSRANLEPVAESLFMETFDPNAVKYQHTSTKVVGQDVKYLQSTGSTTTNSYGGGEQWSHSSAESAAETVNWNHTDTEGVTASISKSHSDNTNGSLSEGHSDSEADGSTITVQSTLTSGAVTTRGTNSSQTQSRSAGMTCNASVGTGVTHTLGRPGDELDEELTVDERNGYEQRRPDYHLLAASDADRTEDDRLKRVTRQLALSEQRNRSLGASQTDAASRTIGDSYSQARQSAEARGVSAGSTRTNTHAVNRSRTTGSGTADADGISLSNSRSSADSFGGSATSGTTDTDTYGTSSQWSRANGESISSSPTLFSVFSREKDAPIFRTIEEQMFMAMMKIAALKDRQAYVLTSDMTTPELMTTPDVHRSPISKVCVDLCIGWYQRQSGLALQLPDLLRQIAKRDSSSDQSDAPALDADIHAPFRRRIDEGKRS